ncbi:MAG: hypothetical protein K2J48_09495 [Muribaculaceae bacterium]|nr:hypothetical protein [Muribaculaceae bacterium]
MKGREWCEGESVSWWNQGIIHSQLRRSFSHDYKRPGVYLITVLKNDSIPTLSSLRGNPSDENNCYAELSETGRMIVEAVREFNNRNEGILNIRHYVVMPDHLHFTIRVMEKLKFHLGIYLSYFFKDCSHRVWRYQNSKGDSFFKRGYNDKILYQYEQWVNRDNYIAENPRRALLRQLYPQFYYNGVIKREDGKIFNSYGNIALISYPEKILVRYTSKRSREDNMARNRICRELAEEGFVMVSPFIHGMEKELWMEGLERGWKMIRIIENAFENRKHPSKTMHEYCSTGNLLLVSLRRIGERSDQTLSKRDICMEMNGLAEMVVDNRWRY